jgi:putative transcriptional regulator
MAYMSTPRDHRGTPLEQLSDPAGEISETTLFKAPRPEFEGRGRNDFLEAAEGARRAAARVLRLPLPDIAALRLRMNFTQSDFARCFGFPLATLRHWEQGTRSPVGASLVLLNIIARHPRVVLTTVARHRMVTRARQAIAGREAGATEVARARQRRAARRSPRR